MFRRATKWCSSNFFAWTNLSNLWKQNMAIMSSDSWVEYPWYPTCIPLIILKTLRSFNTSTLMAEFSGAKNVNVEAGPCAMGHDSLRRSWSVLPFPWYFFGRIGGVGVSPSTTLMATISNTIASPCLHPTSNVLILHGRLAMKYLRIAISKLLFEVSMLI